MSARCETCEEKSCAAAVLSDAELELMSDHFAEVTFEKGEILFHEGALNSHVIYLRKGLVKIHMKVTDDKDYILKICIPSCYLGLATIFGDRVNQYSATALEPVTVCMIDVDTFKQLIFKNGRFAYEIIADICKEDLYDFRRYVSQAHKHAPGRLAGVLIYFADVVYKNHCYELPLTRHEIAELIGMSRENVARNLSEFKDDGIIDVDKNKICILKPEVLSRISVAG